MIRLSLILLCLSAPASAQIARVYSGEHGEFTRLVVELPTASEWVLGRTADGYGFAAKQYVQPDYDFSGVWQRISRARATEMDTDPETGALLLTLGCACHVFPFEYRPGVVVLDIKPGAPPNGSAFEEEFVRRFTAAISPDSLTVAAPSTGYDWLVERPLSSIRSPSTPLPLVLATGEVSLQPLRDALLERIARGAADGVVDIGPLAPSKAAIDGGTDVLPWSSIRIGEQPGVLVGTRDSIASGILSASTCTDNALLDIAAWGGAEAPMELLAASRSGLYGEFDVVDVDAVVDSVRLHLHLGFGAEAIQHASLVTDQSDDETLALYRSMAHIIDGESDPGTPFASMLDCDGPAALWAALARDRLPRGPGINRDAILRAFVALPPHLRGHLGSSLATKFLALGDPDAARMIRDAMARAPHVEAADVALLDAESSLHLGNADAAQRQAQDAVALDGRRADSLVTLVETHFRKLEPVGSDVPEALLSLQREVGRTELGNSVERAIILSQALSGQIEAAFQHKEPSSKVLADLWRVVESRASDDDFLRHAILPKGSLPPDLASDLGLDIANRLLGLGFPDAARAWIGPALLSDPPHRRLLAARAELGLGNARSAIDLLVGISDAEAAAIRAKALLQLGDFPAAADALSLAGMPEAEKRAKLWQGEPGALGPSGSEAWQRAAQVSDPAATDASTGLLGRAASAIEASLSARTAIDALLTSVAVPDGG